MNRRGNCYDNALAESFFQLLKRERVRRKTYLDREEARREIFDYIKMFYNPKRRHSYANDVSPAEFENPYSTGYRVPRKAGLFTLSTNSIQNRLSGPPRLMTFFRNIIRANRRLGFKKNKALH